MSNQNLPEIDPVKRIQRLKSKLSDSEYTVTELELLAEALRDQRDAALQRVAELEAERDQRSVEAKDPVAKITDLE